MSDHSGPVSHAFYVRQERVYRARAKAVEAECVHAVFLALALPLAAIFTFLDHRGPASVLTAIGAYGFLRLNFLHADLRALRREVKVARQKQEWALMEIASRMGS